MTKFLVYLVGFCLSLSAAAGDFPTPPNFTFSGKTIAEKQVQWAWWALPRFLQACQYSTECGLSGDQKALLQKILPNLAGYTADTLQFKPESQYPGLYRSDLGEIHRVAVTGLVPNAPIDINNELLNKTPSLAGFSLWMGFLAHEMVHHLGIADDDKRIPDQFGAAIAKAAESLLIRWPLSASKAPIEAWVLNYPAPNTTGFWSTFPNGLLPVPFFVDSVQIYNIGDLAATLIEKQDLCAEGERLLVQRVSPLTEHERPAQKDGLQTATMTYTANSYCFDVANKKAKSEPNSLNELLDFGDGVIRFDSFIFSYGEDDAQSGTESRVQYVDGALNSDQIQAGKALTVTATIRDTGMEKAPVTCGARFSRPDWPKFMNGVPFSVYHDSCKILKHDGDTYQILVTKNIPADALAGPMEVDSVCLSPGDPNVDGCYVATPPRPLTFTINNKPVAPMKVVNAQILGAKPAKFPDTKRYFYVPKGGLFTLSVQIDGAAQVDQGFLEGNVVTDKQQMAAFTGPLISDDKFLVKAMTVKKTSTGVILNFDIELFQQFNSGLNLMLLKFTQLSFVSQGLQAATINFGDYDFAVMFEDYVPDQNK